MKRFLLLILFTVFFIPLGLVYAAQTSQSETPGNEEISLFVSEIVINQDTSVSITEQIDYYTPEEKHGIYRYIPEKYRKEGWISSNRVSEIKVTDVDGKRQPFDLIRENGNVTIKIGDPDETFLGYRKYIISYRVAGAVMRQTGFDELYWDITGEGWQFPIRKTEVDVKSPFATPLEIACFNGPVGGTSSECFTNLAGKIRVENDTTIGYGDNLTIALKLDRNNNLVFPSTVEKKINFVKDNAVFLLLFLPGILMFLFWYKKGRDFRFSSPNAFNLDLGQPQALRPVFEPINIPMVYEPLKYLTPGEAGTMLDEKTDNQDVIAEIIDLARKKFLKIERVENKGFLKFGHDYLFTKLIENLSGLPEQQKYLMEHIFNSKTEVKLADLKGTFYTHMTKVKEMIGTGLKKKGLFTSSPNSARVRSFALATVVDVLVFIATIGFIVFLQEAWPVIVLLISFGASMYFAWNMPQKTAFGTNLALQTKGLRETIRLGKWREEIKEKHLFIEEVLPFAVSLGVIGKLTKDMAALNIEPPKYMSGGFGSNTIAWSGFVSDFSHSASSGLSYNPSSSSSGGSGFSGGSSGGGGGGGGGGSW